MKHGHDSGMKNEKLLGKSNSGTEDQRWCPDWLVNWIQTYLTALWNLRNLLVRRTAAEVAADIIDENLPNACSYTFVDPCAGAGGPIPAIEKALNAKYGFPVKCILADLRPCVKEWEAIQKKQESISFIEDPVDATKCAKVTPGRECRVFNIAFHHFDDESAQKILSSAMQSGDAFIVFEFLQRDLTTFLFWCLTTVSPLPLLHTPPQLQRFPWCIFAPFVSGLALIPLAIDGFVSMLRTRTPEEIKDLTGKPGCVSDEWTFKHGRSRIVGPWYLHWQLGYKPLSKEAKHD
ncbi:hypothetical protein BDV26DRAFT_287369 [Aspergillus bertholletiae]|uniref:S-adenosyl-L-methionine-dependent methyltransferase n=1 Tax=Aspergillus bertholletiae TaxID=1226010 RepID=A0A5N7BNW5_9EURO|nr:hypothetical protein BDV26DRAFT_287369 [Aspergillus bertholletiae]